MDVSKVGRLGKVGRPWIRSLCWSLLCFPYNLFKKKDAYIQWVWSLDALFSWCLISGEISWDVSNLQVGQIFSAGKIIFHLESKSTGISMDVDGSLALGNCSLLICHCLQKAVSIHSLWWRSMIFPTHFGTLKSSPYARCLEHLPTFGLSYGKCRYIRILYMEPFSKVHASKKMGRIHWSLQHFTAAKDLETSRWQPWKGFLLTAVTITRWETCPARIEWVCWLFLLPPMQLAESFALKSVGKKNNSFLPRFLKTRDPDNNAVWTKSKVKEHHLCMVKELVQATW